MEREGIFCRAENTWRGSGCRQPARNTAAGGYSANRILRAAGRAMEMERIWGQYPEDDAGWMIL